VSKTGADTAFFKLEAGKSMIFGNDDIEVDASGGASSAFVEADNISAKANGAACDVILCSFNLIRITQDSANNVVITTTEKGSASHYLFRFFSLSTNINAYCVADDTSPYPERYNAFTITDTASPTATDAEVDLATGEYKYYRLRQFKF
jgi:hypothetical protein